MEKQLERTSEKAMTSRTRLLAYTGIFAALTVVFTAYLFHIPVGMNGGYIHFGDTLIYLSATLLPLPYALAVGALGSGIADLLTAPMWAIATVIIKMLIVLPFSSKGTNVLNRRNIVAPILSFFISATGYYLAEMILFGSRAALLTAFSGSLVQSGGSAVLFYILAAAFQSSGLKKRMF